MTNKNPQKLGMIARRKQAIDQYIAVRKVRSQEIRDYFASEGESDPERLAAQKARDQEFLRSLKKLGIGFIIFLLFYAILKTALGLW
ncbi:hypothetical protein ACVR05_04755 [Streptococcus caprae]|uniref:Uncharacterized protein n=1 Tax=Streptococcus caprae TaxID=1640501 RepID=A0ABV8CYW1_9STRE|nr:MULTISPECIES: hypothetical protein [Streptococcus]MEE3698292.1 hypothetical protein [Streptococcus uberis]HEL0231688.1 hypothetical protein [Streptococcus equi subsp. zooepidemicus]EGS26836.1 hypothetical protein FSLSAGS3026_10660 [Streptococcus agalactiae FSL S3-026]EGS28466.1 hypothetical protein FSLSAGS3026_01033 [Streptococcus agalactiae FSL S3-026]KLL92873.1 hypothetical protein VZ98_00250 [Streptococcus agalactiae]